MDQMKQKKRNEKRKKDERLGKVLTSWDGKKLKLNLVLLLLPKICPQDAPENTYISQSVRVSLNLRKTKQNKKFFSNLIRKWKLEEKWKTRSSALKLAYSTAFLAGNQIYSGLLQNSFCTLYNIILL